MPWMDGCGDVTSLARALFPTPSRVVGKNISFVMALSPKKNEIKEKISKSQWVVEIVRNGLNTQQRTMKRTARYSPELLMHPEK